MNYIITNMGCLLCQGLISYVSGTILEGNHNITEPSIYPSVGIDFILRICQIFQYTRIDSSCYIVCKNIFFCIYTYDVKE